MVMPAVKRIPPSALMTDKSCCFSGNSSGSTEQRFRFFRSLSTTLSSCVLEAWPGAVTQARAKAIHSINRIRINVLMFASALDYYTGAALPNRERLTCYLEIEKRILKEIL